jgi:hypothetical protein
MQLCSYHTVEATRSNPVPLIELTPYRPNSRQSSLVLRGHVARATLHGRTLTDLPGGETISGTCFKIVEFTADPLYPSPASSSGSNFMVGPGNDQCLSANSDCETRAIESVSLIGPFPPKAHKTVSFFVSFYGGAS